MTPAAWASFCLLATLLILRYWLGAVKPLAGLLICLGCGLVVGLLALAVLPAGRGALLDIRELVQLLGFRREMREGDAG
jgi:hypothetical protein